MSSVTFQNAIYMYDWAKFRAQKTGFETNLTNGAVLGKYGTTSATIMGPSTSNVNETKPPLQRDPLRVQRREEVAITRPATSSS